MMRIGLYMNDLGLHDTSREMVLSGIKPLPQLEMARDQVLELPEKYMIKLILVFRWDQLIKIILNSKLCHPFPPEKRSTK